jgi:DNA invertase Pin-like site-specific DNA recombinase
MNKGKRIGYIRVSTVDQNPERQLEGIELDKKFIEYASGTTLKRPKLEELLNYVRDDDIVIVHSMDRLARNVKDLRQLIDDFLLRNIQVQFIKENLIFTAEKSPISNLILTIMGAIAEFEHSILKERQAEGILIAKKKGKYTGRKKCMNNEKIEMLKNEMNTRKSKLQIASELGISRASLYKYLKKIEL